jgi:hypothetical protein
MLTHNKQNGNDYKVELVIKNINAKHFLWKRTLNFKQTSVVDVTSGASGKEGREIKPSGQV